MYKKSFSSPYQTFVQALSQLKKQGRAAWHERRLYVCYGASSYMLGKCAEFFKQNLREQCDAATHILDGSEVSAKSLGELLSQCSLFDPASAYILHRADKVGDLGQVFSMFTDTGPSPSFLVMLWDGAINEKSKKVLVQTKAELIHVADPTLRDLPDFVAALARKHALTLQSDAAQLLIDAVGLQPALLENEIKRLALIFAGTESSSAPMPAKQIAPYLDTLKEDLAFKLKQLIMAGQRSQAWFLCVELLQRGEAPLAILGLLAKHLRQSILTKSMADAGENNSKICELSGVPSYSITTFRKYVNSISMAKFQEALRLCGRADRLFKSSPQSSDLILGQIVEALT